VRTTALAYLGGYAQAISPHFQFLGPRPARTEGEKEGQEGRKGERKSLMRGASGLWRHCIHLPNLVLRANELGELWRMTCRTSICVAMGRTDRDDEEISLGDSVYSRILGPASRVTSDGLVAVAGSPVKPSIGLNPEGWNAKWLCPGILTRPTTCLRCFICSDPRAKLRAKVAGDACFTSDTD